MKRLTPIKAIRKHCMDCSCNERAEVRNCVIPNCPLYPFRMGKRPISTTFHKNISQKAENTKEA